MALSFSSLHLFIVVLASVLGQNTAVKAVIGYGKIERPPAKHTGHGRIHSLRAKISKDERQVPDHNRLQRSHLQKVLENTKERRSILHQPRIPESILSSRDEETIAESVLDSRDQIPEPTLIEKTKVAEPSFIFGGGWPVIFGFGGLYVIMSTLTLLYFFVRSRTQSSVLHAEANQHATSQINDSIADTVQRGYTKSSCGTFVKTGWQILIALQLIAMNVTLLDKILFEKGVKGWKEGTLLKFVYLSSEPPTWESYSRLAILLWFLSTISISIAKAHSQRFRTFFLVPQELRDATILAFKSAADTDDSEQELFEVDASHRFERNYQSWVYQESRLRFTPLEPEPIPHPASATTEGSTLDWEQGLMPADAQWRLVRFGKNTIYVPVPSRCEAFWKEMSSWGSFYQWSCVWIALYWAVYPQFFLWSFITATSCAVTALMVRANISRIAAMADLDVQVQVKRGGRWATYSSKEIVPGDIIEIAQTVPADVALLRGFAVIDESMLTGESMPVQKFAAPETCRDLAACPRKHLLSAGTAVLSSGQTDSQSTEGKLIGIVIATGINTQRGELIRDILQPRRVRMKHHIQFSYFLMGLMTYGVLIFIAQLIFNQSGSRSQDLLVGLFNILQVISPLLPAALLVGETVACDRLQKKGIYSLVPSLVVLAGRIRVFCFDKTGTLTKEGLQLISCHEVEPGDNEFRSIVSMSKGTRYSLLDELQGDDSSNLGAEMKENLEPSLKLQLGIASCHTVTLVGGKYVGNPVEVEMMCRSGWELVPLGGQQKTLQGESAPKRILRPSGTQSAASASMETIEVLKQFEFDHNMMTQSVVIEHNGKCYAFCKGAYERVQDVIKSGKLPKRYMPTCEMHSRRGCYVIAMGFKEVVGGREAAVNLKRPEVESGMELLGLLLFRNEEKDDTPAAIATLNEGCVRQVILTGDNVLTGIHIARKVGICNKFKPFKLGKLDPEGNLIWINPDSAKPDDTIPAPLPTPRQTQDSIVDEVLIDHPEELAISGDALAWLEKHNSDLLETLFLRIRVFGRVQPMQKVQVVEMFKHRGLTTGMCGDGGNDCGALKAAHIGVALSDAEASIVAPFNVKDKSVKSCELLAREGCSALACSFGLFKFFVLYGITFTLMKTTLLANRLAFLPGWAYLHYDLLMNPLLSLFIAKSHSATKLTKHRPTVSLLGPQFLSSLCSLAAASIGMLACVWWLIETAGDWLVHFNGRNLVINGEKVSFREWWKFVDTFEGPILMAWFSVILFSHAVACTHGHHFRQGVYWNVPLWLGGLLLCSVPMFALWTGPNPLSCLYRTNCDKAHMDLVWKIPVLPYLSQEHIKAEYNAPGPNASNVITDTVWKVKFSILCVVCFFLHQIVEQLISRLVGPGKKRPTGANATMALASRPNAEDDARSDGSIPDDSSEDFGYKAAPK